MKNLFVLVLSSVLLFGCASTPDYPPKDPETIEAPYGAREFCNENPKSELCLEANYLYKYRPVKGGVYTI